MGTAFQFPGIISKTRPVLIVVKTDAAHGDIHDSQSKVSILKAFGGDGQGERT